MRKPPGLINYLQGDYEINCELLHERKNHSVNLFLGVGNCLWREIAEILEMEEKPKGKLLTLLKLEENYLKFLTAFEMAPAVTAGSSKSWISLSLALHFFPPPFLPLYLSFLSYLVVKTVT